MLPRRLFPAVLATVLATAPLLRAAPPDEAAVTAQVHALLASMTQEEKIGQLVQYSQPGAETGPVMPADIETEIAAGRCGSLLNLLGARKTRAAQRLAVERTRLHIPLLFGYDVIHGYRTTFPVNLGQAASWDLAAIEQSERIAATEAAAAGVHWSFAPMVDIARDPRWGRIAEGSGEDPFLGSAIARARVHGFQGDDLSRPDTVLACVKHFAGYGAAQAGRDYYTTDIPEITLRETYLPPYHAAIDAGAATVMAAFNDLNGVPCSANHFLLTEILRHEWGFHGFVVSDWASVRQLVPHGIAADNADAARLALNAGLDMDMENHAFGPHLAALIQSGAVSEARLDEAVSAVLAAKVRLGLFEDPYRYSDEAREQAAMLRPESLAAAQALARESCVLLKNDHAALPLAAGAKIALVGALADSHRDQLGPWQSQGQNADAITLRAALEKSFPGRVTYTPGCTVTGDDTSGFSAAIAAAQAADVVVAVLGETAEMSGEAGSRADLGLPGRQLELLQQLHDTGKPVVLVVYAGRPLTLAPALAAADAVLYAWFPGLMGGPALVDLLSGAASPSGKLPVTFPRSVGQIPIFYAHKNSGRPADPNGPVDRFTSRYLDLPNSPQFPFGFGLSYTTFAYSHPQLSTTTLTSGGELHVTVTLTNTGARAGTEIAQLYVRDLVGSVTRPVRELKGFERVTLQPGEARDVTFTLKPADLAFVHADLTTAPEAGDFDLFLGGDSDAPKIGSFTYADKAAP